MKKIILSAAIILSVFSSGTTIAQGKKLIYDKKHNSSIELHIGNLNTKQVAYHLKNEKNQTVQSGMAPVNKKFKIGISDLPSGVYKLVVNGFVNEFEIR